LFFYAALSAYFSYLSRSFCAFLAYSYASLSLFFSSLSICLAVFFCDLVSSFSPFFLFVPPASLSEAELSFLSGCWPIGYICGGMPWFGIIGAPGGTPSIICICAGIPGLNIYIPGPMLPYGIPIPAIYGYCGSPGAIYIPGIPCIINGFKSFPGKPICAGEICGYPTI